MNAIRFANAGLQTLLKPEKVRGRPIHIQFEPTSYCNLACTSCPHHIVVKNPRHLSLENFVRVFDQIRPLRLTFSGLGEPLLNPKFFEMVEYGAKNGAVINTTSNGSLLNSDKIIDRLIASQLTLISVSLDAATAGTYLQIRKEDYFDRITKGLRELIRRRNEAGRKDLNVRLCFVVSRTNLHEMNDFVRLAKDIGVDLVFFQVLRVFEENESDREVLVGGLSQEHYLEKIRETEALAREVGMHTNLGTIEHELPRTWQAYEGKQDEGMCPLPWFSLYVDVDGHIRPCCQCSADVTTRMGPSLFETPLEEVWNGKKYQGFRKAIREGKRPIKVCRGCVPDTLGDMARRSLNQYSPGFL